MNSVLLPITSSLKGSSQLRVSPLLQRLALAAAVSFGLAGTAQAQTPGFAFWSLKRGATDSTAVRSAGLTPAAAVFKRLTVSNGAAPGSGTTAPAYSSFFGQAFAVTADGGGWPRVTTTTPATGIGGAPRRTFYEQFSVTATAATRLDSLLFTAASTNAQTGRVAVMYSLSNFTADSSNFTGAKGPAYAGYTSGTTTVPASAGGVLPATADGSFGATSETTPMGAIVPQSNATTGYSGVFHFAFNGSTGLTLAAGQTLSVRIYPTINNSAVGRYFLLKNVTLRSQSGTPLATRATRALTTLAVYPNPAADQLTVQHAAAPAGAQVALYAATGQRVAVLAVRPGTTDTTLPMSQLASGLYLAEYTDGQLHATARVVKP